MKMEFEKKVFVKEEKVKKIKQKKVTSLQGDRKNAVVNTSFDPYYPKDAINLGWEGKVTIQAYVNKKGKVTRVKLIKSSGYPLLDDAFINAVYASYTFKPKRIMGKNKMDKITLSYQFKI